MRTLLRERFGNLNAAGKFWMWAGLITLACSMGMAYDYASQVSWKHGLVLAAVSFATAFLPEEAYKQWRNGLRGVAIGLVAVSIPMFWQEAKSHIAYTAGFRGINVETATLQQTKYDDQRGSREQALRDIQSAQAAIDRLKWLPSSVTVHGIRAEIANLEGNHIYRRSKECANVTIPESRSFCDKLTEARKQLGAAEDLVREKERLAAAQRWLQTAQEKAASLDHKPSIVQHQNTTLFKLASLLTNGGTEASPLLKEVVEQENTVGLALMPVILPALCFFMMGLYRKDDEPDAPIAQPTPHVARETVNTTATVHRPEHMRLGDAAALMASMKATA